MTIAADPKVAAAYMAAGWWGHDTPTDLIRHWAATRPEDTAYISWRGQSRPQSPEKPSTGTIHRTTWAEYDRLSDHVAAGLMAAGLNRGDRVAVIMPDSAGIHAALTGADKAGLVVMGIGHRAGPAEIIHLVRKSEARAIITESTHRGQASADLVAELQKGHPDLTHHLIVNDTPAEDTTSGLADGEVGRASVILDGQPVAEPESPADLVELIEKRRLGASELCLLNSTSGTTGLPKCVMQTHNRWFYFHQKAVEYAGLGNDEVFCVPVPTPFGFGLWTTHYTPTILGVPTVVMADFNAEALIRLIETERVTVLCAVTTQFIMMLNSPALDHHDLSSLRVMFTGGEAIPEQRATEFEDRTGCTVLNFYGSNETGMLSGTRLSDPRSARLRSGGRCEPEMDCRLYDPDDGHRLPELQGRGQPACRGPATALGYYNDPKANAELVTDDGWMLMGDIVEIDTDGYLRVVGRTSDFIIRGGKNISAPAVEDEVMTHPAVAMVAAVPAPDPVFGERVAAYVELYPGITLNLDGLRQHLANRGVSREWWPEHLFVVDALPRSSGGKVAKGRLKEDAAARVSSEPAR